MVWPGPHGWWPFKIREVSNEGQESIIGNVEYGELGRGGGGGGGGGVSFLVGLSIRALMVLALVAFLLGRTLGGRFPVLGGYHNSLRRSSDVVFQSREFICSAVQFFHSGWRV